MSNVIPFPMPTSKNTPRQEAEAVVLARLLFHFDSPEDRECAAHLRPQDFQEPEHAAIFEAMKYLLVQSESTDIIAVGSRLEETGKLEEAGGRVYLMDLAMCKFREGNMAEAIRHLQLNW